MQLCDSCVCHCVILLLCVCDIVKFYNCVYVIVCVPVTQGSHSVILQLCVNVCDIAKFYKLCVCYCVCAGHTRQPLHAHRMPIAARLLFAFRVQSLHIKPSVKMCDC